MAIKISSFRTDISFVEHFFVPVLASVVFWTRSIGDCVGVTFSVCTFSDLWLLLKFYFWLGFQNLHICLSFTFAILIVFPLMWDFIASAPILLRLSTFAHVTCKMVFFLEKDIKNTNQHNENKKMVSLIQGYMLFYSFLLLVCIWEQNRNC